MERPTGTASRRKKNILIPGIVLLGAGILLVCALLVRNGSVTARNRKPVEFVLMEGNEPCYAPAGTGLAAATTAGFQVFASDGSVTTERVQPMDTPVCAASSWLCIFYDVGEPDLVTVRADGVTQVLETEGGVTFAHANDDGALAVVAEREGYKGSVTVYDRRLTALFRWDSGSGYPVTARVSDQGVLVVNCAGDQGSVLHGFRTDQEDELFSYTAPGELILDFGFLSGGSLAAVTESRLIVLDESGEEILSHPFPEAYLTAFSLEGDVAVVAASTRSVGGSTVLTVADGRGRVLEELDTGREVLGLDTSGNRVLVLYPTEATLYSSRLEDIISYQKVENVTQVFLRADGTALLAGPSGVTGVYFGR